ncbi:hypothetical protein H6G17_02585 [Chroococcidiopsis sp. FACHB-1243]|uniref:DUF6717 family protein n=1 Tax=Chroococcidiopsis sp. [FACHB-1243] TaxID=2692781 RepID=UPI00177C5DD2|nr:DUF6717 family protein [Chroococcidiopsis sp. [FACHB-1243]]MBD2304409.1 hypothetical protein [Chroococcidiopsis sp. [FACHB-1243]]
MANAIMVIFPYRYQQTWVFDDETVGLFKEPFVSGIPEMLDILVKDISHHNAGFRLLFSATAFPKFQTELIWIKEEFGGHWYCWQQQNLEGWLCPALFKYFTEPPQKISCKAESLYT